MIRGIPPLAGRTTYPLIEQLVAAYEQDRTLKRAPENHQYVPAKVMRSRLSVEDASLRSVRRQSFWDSGLVHLREALARLLGDVKRPADDAASVDW
jgi:hypothetical protein